MNDVILPPIIEKKNEEKMAIMEKDFHAVTTAMDTMPSQISKIVETSSSSIVKQVENLIAQHSRTDGAEDGFRKGVIAIISEAMAKSDTAISALNGMISSSISALQHQTAELREDTQKLFRDLGATGVIKNGTFMDGVKSGVIRYKNIVLSIPMLIVSLIMIKSTKIHFNDEANATDVKVTTENFFSFIKTESKGDSSLIVRVGDKILAELESYKVSKKLFPSIMVQLGVYNDTEKRYDMRLVPVDALIIDKVITLIDDVYTILLPTTYVAGKKTILMVPVLREVSLSTNLQLTTLVESTVYVAVAGWNQIAGLFVGLFSTSLGDIVQLGKKGLGLEKLFNKAK